MENLINYLNESLNESLNETLNENAREDEEELLKNLSPAEIKMRKELHRFFKKNYTKQSFQKYSESWESYSDPWHYLDSLMGEVVDFENKIVNCTPRYKTEIIKVLPTATQLLPDGWKFGKVVCHFDISDSQIKDLSQAPNRIDNNLYMNNCNNITSFEGNVETVKGNIYANNCSNLTSWEGLPQKVKGKVVTKGSPLPDPNAEATNETPENCPTLYDCLKHHIKTFGFKRTYGPSHFPEIVLASKLVTKKYKPIEIKTTEGNRADPMILANLLFSVAPKIKVDYNLTVEKRIKDISDQAYDLMHDAYGDSEAGGVQMIFDVDPVITRRIDGYKHFAKKTGVPLAIRIAYKSGELTINIDENSPLFK